MYLPADALAGGEFPQPLLDLLTAPSSAPPTGRTRNAGSIKNIC